MKISIITVSLNADKLIERTLSSVISQTYQNLEYIVIDGVSSDKTIDIINKYSSKISLFISEPDHGIYDAMNKAIEYATGDWILFLNAGDLLISNTTLCEINSYLNDYKDSALIYGDVLIDFNFSINHIHSNSIEHIKYSMVTNHQACFINTKIHKEIKYDLIYKIASDYDLIFKLYINGYKIVKINKVISKVQAKGISDKNRDKTFREYLNIRNKYNKNIVNYIHFYYGFLYFQLSRLLKFLLPNGFIIQIYKMKANF